MVGNNFRCSPGYVGGYNENYPDNDPDKTNSVCGSSDLNRAIYSYITIFALCFIAMVISIKLMYHNSNNNTNTNTSSSIEVDFGTRSRDLSSSSVADIVVMLQDFYDIDKFLDTSSYPDLRHFVDTIRSIKSSIVMVAGLICVIAMPLYCILKIKSFGYRTHTYVYGWMASAAMLQTSPPALLIMLLWALVIAVLLVRLTSSLMKTDNVIIRDTNSSILSSSVGNSVSVRSTTISAARSTITISDSTPVSWRLFTFKLVRFYGFLLVNISFSLLLNGVYVYWIVSQSSTAILFIQLGVALARIIWNKGITMFVALPYFDISTSQKSVFYTWVYIFNNVMAPFLAFVFSDKSCLLNIFIKQEKITSSYDVVECYSLVYDQSSDYECTEYREITYTTTYEPPFVYNYQCGSSLITALVPVFLYANILNIVLAVILQALIVLRVDLQSYLPSWSLGMFPTIMISAEPEKSSRGAMKKSIFNASAAVAFLVEHCAVLVSYGLVVPYVAVAVALSAVTQYMLSVSLISLYFQRAMENIDSVQNPIDTDPDLLPGFNYLNRSCGAITNISLPKIWIIIAYSSFFLLGLFVLDIAADNQNTSWRSAVIILSISFVIPLGILCIYAYGRKCLKSMMIVLGGDKNTPDLELKSVDSESNVVNVMHDDAVVLPSRRKQNSVSEVEDGVRLSTQSFRNSERNHSVELV